MDLEYGSLSSSSGDDNVVEVAIVVATALVVLNMEEEEEEYYDKFSLRHGRSCDEGRLRNVERDFGGHMT